MTHKVIKNVVYSTSVLDQGCPSQGFHCKTMWSDNECTYWYKWVLLMVTIPQYSLAHPHRSVYLESWLHSPQYSCTLPRCPGKGNPMDCSLSNHLLDLGGHHTQALEVVIGKQQYCEWTKTVINAMKSAYHKLVFSHQLVSEVDGQNCSSPHTCRSQKHYSSERYPVKLFRSTALVQLVIRGSCRCKLVEWRMRRKEITACWRLQSTFLINTQM